jgi:hypothetical protein
MKQKPGQLKTHRHAQKLVVYLRRHQPATVAAVVLAGLMTSREARGGLQYGIRHGVIERVKRPGAAYKRPFQKDPEGAVNLFGKLLTLAI